MIIGRWAGDKYTTVFKADFDSKGRKMILHAGRASEKVPVQERTKLMKAELSLRHIP